MTRTLPHPWTPETAAYYWCLALFGPVRHLPEDGTMVGWWCMACEGPVIWVIVPAAHSMGMCRHAVYTSPIPSGWDCPDGWGPLHYEGAHHHEPWAWYNTRSRDTAFPIRRNWKERPHDVAAV